MRTGPLAHGFASDQRWTLGRIKTLIGRLFHKDRWRRFMSLVVLLLAVGLALAAVALWWLLIGSGVKLLLYGFGQT